MRIAHIINHLGVSGVNQVVADLVSVFNAHGHECVIYYLKACDSPACYSCPVVPLSGSASLPEHFDVIHAHGIGPMLYVMRHRRALAKRNGSQGRPLFVTTLHCYCYDAPLLLFPRPAEPLRMGKGWPDGLGVSGKYVVAG